MDWTGCDLVESDPAKVGGRHVVKGTRIPAETIVLDEELGCTIEETYDNFPTLSVDAIRKVRAFAHSKQRM